MHCAAFVLENLEIVRGAVYHCDTFIGQHYLLLVFPLLPVPVVRAGFEPSTLRWRGKCSNSVPPLLVNLYFGLVTLPLPIPLGGLDSKPYPWMIRRVIYHCATSVGHLMLISATFSLPVPMAGAAFKPSTLECWGKHSTNVLMMSQDRLFSCCLSLSLCQWQGCIQTLYLIMMRHILPMC